MDKCYRYYKEDDRILRCFCERDEDPQDPIGEEFMLSTMLIWWNRYNLGNENAYDSPENFLFSVLEEYSDDDLIGYAKRQGVTSLDYDDPSGCFSAKDAVDFLQEHDYAIFPLYIYEHSGITIHMGRFGERPGYPFSDRFDAGFAGFVFVKKDEYLQKTGLEKDGWRENAEKCMQSEVELYDMYLQGNVYGLVVEEMENDGEWYERESVWGYFSDNFGDDLVSEIAADHVGKTYLTIEDAVTA